VARFAGQQTGALDDEAVGLLAKVTALQAQHVDCRAFIARVHCLRSTITRSGTKFERPYFCAQFRDFVRAKTDSGNEDTFAVHLRVVHHDLRVHDRIAKLFDRGQRRGETRSSTLPAVDESMEIVNIYIAHGTPVFTRLISSNVRFTDAKVCTVTHIAKERDWSHQTRNWGRS
jgi:hypothetical protein